jgi:hypothetical protein
MQEKDECVIKRITCLLFVPLIWEPSGLNHLLHRVCAMVTFKRTATQTEAE